VRSASADEGRPIIRDVCVIGGGSAGTAAVKNQPFEMMVDSADIARGFYRSVQTLQGRHGTFYTGAAVANADRRGASASRRDVYSNRSFDARSSNRQPIRVIASVTFFDADPSCSVRRVRSARADSLRRTRDGSLRRPRRCAHLV